MNRKSLSNNFLADKVLTGILAAGVLVIWIFYLPFIAVLIFGGLIVGIVAIIAFFPRIKIEFDQENMYIRDQGSDATIALKDVTTLTITNFTFNHRSKWKIIYLNRNEGIEEEVGFYPSSFNLDDFADLVQKKNPGAQIIRSINTFD